METQPFSCCSHSNVVILERYVMALFLAAQSSLCLQFLMTCFATPSCYLCISKYWRQEWFSLVPRPLGGGVLA